MSKFKEVKIGKLGDVITGKTPKTIVKDNYGSDYMFIGPTDLHKHFIITSAEKYISKKGFNSIKNNTIDGLSILVGCIGWDMGNVALVNTQCATNQQINSITNIKQEYNPYYIYYWFKGKKAYLFKISNVTRTPMLNKTDFSDITIQIPNIQTQIQIAKVLSDLDAKIEVNNKINQELEAMTKTLYNYWFVQFDFPNANGKPYKSSGGKMFFHDELKREIPEGWEVKTLLDIASFVNGLACQKFRPKENEDSYRVIKIREMGSGFTENSEFVCVNIPEKIIVSNGDILFSWSATLDVKIWTGGKGALNQHIFKVTSKKYPKSYYYFELLNYLQHFIMQATLRKTTMGHITQDHLKQSRITIPPIDLINRLDQTLKPTLDKKVKLDEENQKLSELRDWLLPMLMNGQVTVGEVEGALGMDAEPEARYSTSLFGDNGLTLNYDYQIGAIVYLTERILERNYGRKYLHKMFSNLQFLANLPKIEELQFVEEGWGMFSKQLAASIDNEIFVKRSTLENGFKVFTLKTGAKKEIKDWIAQNENTEFVKEVKNMLTLYQHPLIEKEMDRIELLNTVLECINVLESYTFNAIYTKMKVWKMKDGINEFKADKFTPTQTQYMIGLIKGIKIK